MDFSWLNYSHTGYLMAFLVGLMGGVHCVGMCGAIVSALSLPKTTTTSRSPLTILLAYNIGRIGSYGIAGAVVAGSGAMLQQLVPLTPIHVAINSLAALFIISLGLYLAGWRQELRYIEQLGRPIWRQLEPLSRRFIPANNIPQALVLGALWGWLPCGLVYSVLVWALSAPNAWAGMGVMLAFGLGTLPNLLLIGLGARKLVMFFQRPQTRHFAGAIVILLGLLMLLLAWR